MQLKDYSNAELMEKGDELSIFMMINKLHRASDFVGLGKEVDAEYLKKAMADTPGHVLDIMAQVIEALLLKINVPYEEATDFAGQVKERRMGELFSNFLILDAQPEVCPEYLHGYRDFRNRCRTAVLIWLSRGNQSRRLITGHIFWL